MSVASQAELRPSEAGGITKNPVVGSHTLPLILLLVVFLASRFIYFLAGIRFNADTLSYWHVIDPFLLRTDLWRSLFYLHSQPPLMNLFLGSVLQVFPKQHNLVFQISYLVVGLVLMFSLYGLAVALRLPRWGAALFAGWFILSPAAILYENWLALPYPLTACLAAAGFCLSRFIRTRRLIWSIMFFSLLAVLALTWALFHILWLLAVSVIVLLFSPQPRTIWLIALLPTLLVTAWYVKNQVVFGEFTASSWAGMNLSKITTFRLPPELREGMVVSGELSKFAEYPPFRNVGLYLKMLPQTEKTSIPMLDAEYTSRDGRNFHHLVYVEAGLYYLGDALNSLRAHPGYYLLAVRQSFYIFFHSASDFDLIVGERRPIESFGGWWNRIFYGQWFNDESSEARNSGISLLNLGWWIVIAFVVILAAGSIYLLNWHRNGTESQYLLIAFMFINIVYVTLVGNFMDVGENNRFRFVVDPFLFLLFIHFVQLGVARLRRGSSSAAS